MGSVAAETESAEQSADIVVTGTNIRGTAPVGASLQVINRDEIDRSGHSTAQQIVASLPQNFGEDAAEDSKSTADAARNTNSGVGVNLRGLGSGSTLVLINGRRTAQGGGLNGSYVDISGLPVTAIERVEILTDGASAIYGSDAIAGVVNFVLRDDFEGLEARLRYGFATEGSLDEYQAGLTGGFRWGTGNILASYEYYRRTSCATGCPIGPSGTGSIDWNSPSTSRICSTRTLHSTTIPPASVTTRQMPIRSAASSRSGCPSGGRSPGGHRQSCHCGLEILAGPGLLLQRRGGKARAVPDGGVRPTAPRPLTIDDLAGLRDIDSFVISPDGRHVAYHLRQAILSPPVRDVDAEPNG